MTPKKRVPSRESASLRFLVDDFGGVDDAPDTAVRALQEEAAALLLPSSPKGLSVQQRSLLALPAADFQDLRRFVGDQLRSIAGHARGLPAGIGLAYGVALKL